MLAPAVASPSLSLDSEEFLRLLNQQLLGRELRLIRIRTGRASSSRPG